MELRLGGYVYQLAHRPLVVGDISDTTVTDKSFATAYSLVEEGAEVLRVHESVARGELAYYKGIQAELAIPVIYGDMVGEFPIGEYDPSWSKPTLIAKQISQFQQGTRVLLTGLDHVKTTRRTADILFALSVPRGVGSQDDANPNQGR